MNWIQNNTDIFLFILMCAIFAIGYYWGRSNGYSQGFTRGRVAGRKHPSAV